MDGTKLIYYKNLRLNLKINVHPRKRKKFITPRQGASSITYAVATTKLNELKFELNPQPSYSLHLVLSDFFVPEREKMAWKEKIFKKCRYQRSRK